jgi:hypothetical protein
MSWPVYPPPSPLTDAQIATITAQLADLNAAIASGIDSTSYEGKSTRFRSYQEMLLARSDLQAQLNAAMGGRRRVRQTKVHSRKAL